MKISIVICIGVVAGMGVMGLPVGGIAQKLREAEVPAPVRAAFAQRYPGVKLQSWNREDRVYEAKFVHGGERRDAEFAGDGTLLATERVINAQDLPAVVLEAFARDYPEHELTEVEEVTDAKTGAITYELDFSRGRLRFEAVYSPTGVLLRQYTDD